MKGLRVGVFFAIRGPSLSIHSVSPRQPWASAQMIEHPLVINCGFVYLLLTCVSGLIGLILFSLIAKRYKYTISMVAERVNLDVGFHVADHFSDVVLPTSSPTSGLTSTVFMSSYYELNSLFKPSSYFYYFNNSRGVGAGGKRSGPSHFSVQ